MDVTDVSQAINHLVPPSVGLSFSVSALSLLQQYSFLSAFLSLFLLFAAN
jgi:hypothetical protein